MSVPNDKPLSVSELVKNRAALPSVRVLLVDDDEQYARWVTQVLRLNGKAKFSLVCKTDYKSAARFLASEVPDAILLDLHLPDSSGLDTLSRIREVAGDCPIIVLTGTESSQNAIQAVSLGAQDYLIKQHIGNDSLSRCLLYTIERRKADAELLRSKAIQDFTKTLAHDLQVPMIGVVKVLDALLGGHFGQLPPEVVPAISELRSSSQDQLKLVQRLMEIYEFEKELQHLQFELISIKDVLEAWLEEESASSAKINLEIQDDLPQMSGNKEALRILFENLLDNAIKYGDGMTPIVISGHLTEEKLVISVSNSGRPMPQEIQKHIFDGFWQGIPGTLYVARTGFGLYLCHRISRVHKAKISCDSTQNGTTVTVRFPVISEHPPRPRGAKR